MSIKLAIKSTYLFILLITLSNCTNPKPYYSISPAKGSHLNISIGNTFFEYTAISREVYNNRKKKIKDTKLGGWELIVKQATPEKLVLVYREYKNQDYSSYIPMLKTAFTTEYHYQFTTFPKKISFQYHYFEIQKIIDNRVIYKVL